MTLKLASTDDLLSELPAVQEVLGRVGLRSATEHGRSRLAPLLESLSEGLLDVVLTSGRAFGTADPPDVSFSVLRRDDARDVYLPADGQAQTLVALPAGGRVGLSGARRVGFLRAHRDDLTPVAPWNGGGPDESLRSGAVDALVMSSSQARRLGLAARVGESLDTGSWVPSVGEGALILLFGHRHPSAEFLVSLDQASSRGALMAERAAMVALGASGNDAVGVLGLPHGDWIRLWGMVASRDGRHVVRSDLTGSASNPESLGRALADVLLRRGAGRFIGESPQ